jgi:SOS-response transcriptional repressor LexA
MPVERGTQRDEPDTVIALRLIKESVEGRGYPPSRREIADACGWASPSSSHDLIRLMEAQGLVRTAKGIPRALQITEAGMVALTQSV